jgi:hypothetical protein
MHPRNVVVSGINTLHKIDDDDDDDYDDDMCLLTCWLNSEVPIIKSAHEPE